jgi:hypothetical protein
LPPYIEGFTAGLAVFAGILAAVELAAWAWSLTWPRDERR